MTTTQVLDLLVTAENALDERAQSAEGPRRDDLHTARSRIAMARHLLVMSEANENLRRAN